MTRAKKKKGDEIETQGKDQKSRLVEILQAWMVVRLAEELKVSPAEIDTRKPLLDYGLDSVIAFSLTGELAEMTGREFPVTLFWDFPTVEALSVYMASQIQYGETEESLAGEIHNALSQFEELPEGGVADTGQKKD